MADRYDRSAAEREAARLERARRRAEAGAPPPRSFAGEQRYEQDHEDDARIEDRRGWEADTADQGHPGRDGGLAYDDDLTAEHEVVFSDEPTFAHDRAFDHGDGHDRAFDHGEGFGHEPADDGGLGHENGRGADEDPPAPGLPLGGDELAERPSGTRRVSHLQAGPRQRARRERKPRAPRRRASPGAARTGTAWVGRIVSLIALILAAALIWFLVQLFQPFGTSPHGKVTVTVAPHSGSRAIGDQLARDGVIPSGFFFALRATLAGDRSQLRAGTYHLQLGMSYASVLTALTKLPKAAKTTDLTISEGHTRAYVSHLLRRQKISGNYLAATRSSKLLDPHRYGAPRRVSSLEGFLFPDTFSLVDPVKVRTLVTDQLSDFKRRFAGVNLGYAKRKHLSAYDVLKVASLIEAEAASARDRPLVASVIYNRLADGMMLQLDSTTRYATGNFTRPLLVSQLRSPSPYNTHTHFGLPPTPIDSPGLAAIQAAAHPATSKYLFFFSLPCSSRSAFATTYSQFLTLLARDKRTHCPG